MRHQSRSTQDTGPGVIINKNTEMANVNIDESPKFYSLMKLFGGPILNLCFHTAYSS